MTDLEQQKTIESMLKDVLNRYHLELPKSMVHRSLNSDIVNQAYGNVKIISPIKLWSLKWNHCMVLCQCQKCKTVKWINYSALRRQKTKGCQHCSKPRQIPRWLERRLSAAKSRCENPEDPAFPLYGGRGIRFCFGSVLEAGLYLLSLYNGKLNRNLQLDRIDTNGNYEAGNLRMVTREENIANRRITVLSEFRQVYWPYARSVVIRKLSKGMTREEIIEDAIKAVENKTKCWKLIEARLEFMTYSMPDRITVLPYRSA